jgi:hypothetical protein
MAKQSDLGEPLLKPKVVAHCLNVTTRAVQQFAANGTLPGVKIGNRVLRFRRSDIERVTMPANKRGKTEGIRPKSCMAARPRKKANSQKPKLNITLHEETKQKLTALAQLEKRSVSNLIEIMADERWEKLAELEGVDYAKTVAEIAGLKGLNANRAADRKVFRREILERVLKFKKR